MNRESERKRLVELLSQFERTCPENCTGLEKSCTQCVLEQKADHLLDNGIVVPPYKVGAKVYATIGSLSLPIPYAVYEVTIQRYVLATGGLVPVVKLKKGTVTYGEIHTSMGSLYDTREQAQKALEGSGEK